MRNLARLMVLLLAMGLSESVLAGPLEDARAAYVKQDYATALRLFRPLADQGDADAQSMLGLMYDNGQGVPKDDVLAYMWRNLAAAGASDADTRERAAKARDALATMMTPAQVTEAQKRASAWQPK